MSHNIALNSLRDTCVLEVTRQPGMIYSSSYAEDAHWLMIQ